jgi:hypothetical protein
VTWDAEGEAARYADLQEQVGPEHWQGFLQYVATGSAGEAFLRALDESPRLQAAVEETYRRQMDVIAGFTQALLAHEPAHPAPPPRAAAGSRGGRWVHLALAASLGLVFVLGLQTHRLTSENAGLLAERASREDPRAIVLGQIVADPHLPPAAQREVALLLGTMGAAARPAVQDLGTALGKAEVGESAADALGNIARSGGAPESVNVLAAALTDPDPATRNRAGLGLIVSKTAGAGAADAVVTALRSGNLDPRIGYHALAGFGENAVHHLLRAVGGKGQEEVREAVVAVVGMGLEAVRPLKDYLDGSMDAAGRRVAEDALEKIRLGTCRRTA